MKFTKKELEYIFKLTGDSTGVDKWFAEEAKAYEADSPKVLRARIVETKSIENTGFQDPMHDQIISLRLKAQNFTLDNKLKEEKKNDTKRRTTKTGKRTTRSVSKTDKP